MKHNSMEAAVKEHLDTRRQLGFALVASGTELMRFARYADARGHLGPLNQDLILGWAREHVRKTSAVTPARRLEVIRPFAAYYRQFEPSSEVPPLGILGRGHRRLTPHIYTDKEVVQILESAGSLEPRGGLRPLTYVALLGLIAATGLRLSEALGLTNSDVNLATGIITLRQTKFRKSRSLPIHDTVVTALGGYSQACDGSRLGHTAPFFMTPASTAIPVRTVEGVFRRIVTEMGCQVRGDHPAPRIHDLRHTFAVRRLQTWREQHQCIDQALFWLCTYLGHTKISDTYWYLTGVPELMELIGARLEHFATGSAEL
jgi:integrase/recombinase XerC